MSDEKVPLGSITRRQAMKRIGAGAAIVWSAPVLTSLGSKAFGQARSPGQFACSNCTPEQPCNVAFECAGIGDDCVCITRADGSGCACVENFGCTGVTCNPGDPACPAGQACTFSCCGEGAQCVVQCGEINHQTVPGTKATL